MDDDTFGEVEWSLGDQADYPLNWLSLASNALGLARNVTAQVAGFFDDCQDDVLAAHRYKRKRATFQEEASREIETITATTED